MKTGYKTSEMWLTLGNAIIGLLVIYGIVNADQAEGWQVLIAAVIPLALSLATAAYAQGRSNVKIAELNNKDGE